MDTEVFGVRSLSKRVPVPVKNRGEPLFLTNVSRVRKCWKITFGHPTSGSPPLPTCVWYSTSTSGCGWEQGVEKLNLEKSWFCHKGSHRCLRRFYVFFWYWTKFSWHIFRPEMCRDTSLGVCCNSRPPSIAQLLTTINNNICRVFLVFFTCHVRMWWSHSGAFHHGDIFSSWNLRRPWAFHIYIYI